MWAIIPGRIGCRAKEKHVIIIASTRTKIHRPQGTTIVTPPLAESPTHRNFHHHHSPGHNIFALFATSSQLLQTTHDSMHARNPCTVLTPLRCDKLLGPCTVYNTVCTCYTVDLIEMRIKRAHLDSAQSRLHLHPHTPEGHMEAFHFVVIDA